MNAIEKLEVGSPWDQNYTPGNDSFGYHKQFTCAGHFMGVTLNVYVGADPALVAQVADWLAKDLQSPEWVRVRRDAIDFGWTICKQDEDGDMTEFDNVEVSMGTNLELVKRISKRTAAEVVAIEKALMKKKGK